MVNSRHSPPTPEQIRAYRDEMGISLQEAKRTLMGQHLLTILASNPTTEELAYVLGHVVRKLCPEHHGHIRVRHDT